MPRLPAIRVPALRDLAQQLRFAPPAAAARHIARVEALAPELDPAQQYPADYLLFRITGLRPEQSDPAAHTGQEVLADLSAFAEHLSDAAKLHDDDGLLNLDALASRWRVSTKTIARYRRMGLIARRITHARGRVSLAFDPAHVGQFEIARRAEIDRARAFSRLDTDHQAALLARAAQLRQAQGWSLSRVAQALAKESGRAHETIRQLLKRHDAGSSTPIFAERGPPTLRERRLIERATFLGFDASALASHLHRDVRAIRRLTADARAARLRTLAQAKPPPPQGDEPDLTAAPVCEHLGTPAPRDLRELLALARAAPVPLGAVELMRARAYRHLLTRALTAAHALPEHGASPTIVDRIETDLRWAARLKAALIHDQLGTLLRTLESVVGAELDRLRPADLAQRMLSSILAAAAGVDAFASQQRGRLSGAVGLAVNRAATKWTREHAPRPSVPARATPTSTATAAMPDWTRLICPWQSHQGHAWLEPHPSIRTALDHLEPADADLLRRRFGWGPHPHTLVELASHLHLPVVRAAVAERRALLSAHAAARSAAMD